MYLAIVSCTNNWIVIKWNMNSLVRLWALFQVLDGLSDQWTGYHLYLQAVFGKERLWSCGWGGGVFREQPTTQQPLCLPGFSWAGWGRCMWCRHVSLSGPFPNYPLCVCEHGKKCVNMTGCWVAGACPKGWNACQMLHNPPKALRYKSAQVCENQYDAGSLGSG